MKAAIEIQDISVAIDGQTILSHISASIPVGTVIGLLGPSGSGKTTLIRTILGLQKATSGTLAILGSKPGSTKARTYIGYVAQSPSVYTDLTVQENIQYFATLLGIDKRNAEQTLQDVELGEYSNHLVGNLSGGQRTRVSLAIALLGSPKILLLDEPTVGLDPVLRQKLWQKFKRLAAAGTTIIISSHVMDEADQCDELLFIRGGELLASGARRAILTATASDTMEDAFIRLAKGDTP